MNEVMPSDRCDSPDLEHLIVPFSALFGPVYRLRGNAKALRREWIWTVSLGMTIVGTVLLIVFLTGFESSAPVNLFEHPALFWGLIATIVVVRWLMSAMWWLRRRASLHRVEPPISLDARLVAAHGPATRDQLRWHAWIMSALALFYLVPALLLMDRYPWIFGPMAAMFIVQAACAIRVFRFRDKQSKMIGSSDESKPSRGVSR